LSLERRSNWMISPDSLAATRYSPLLEMSTSVMLPKEMPLLLWKSLFEES